MTRRLTTTILAVLVFAGALSGCAAQPDVSEQAATELQSSVRVVAEKAAANDPSAATTELDALQTRLDAAVESSDVSDDRATRIQAAIDSVRADLAAQLAANEAAAVEAQRVLDEQAEADRVALEKQALEQQAAEDAAEDAEDDDKPGKGKGRDDEED